MFTKDAGILLHPFASQVPPTIAGSADEQPAGIDHGVVNGFTAVAYAEVAVLLIDVVNDMISRSDTKIVGNEFQPFYSQDAFHHLVAKSIAET
jgi:hypothetical protein